MENINLHTKQIIDRCLDTVVIAKKMVQAGKLHKYTLSSMRLPFSIAAVVKMIKVASAIIHYDHFIFGLTCANIYYIKRFLQTITAAYTLILCLLTTQIICPNTHILERLRLQSVRGQWSSIFVIEALKMKELKLVCSVMDVNIIKFLMPDMR